MRILTTTLLAGLTLHAQITVTPGDDREEVALQAAVRTEMVDGDLTGAIRQYEAISKGTNRKAAAQALLKMGRCYEKLGDTRAVGAYQMVIHDYADQRDAVQQARRSLGALINKPEDFARPVSSDATVGWYNGDWCRGCARALRSQMLSDVHYSLVYDDFVVPDGGWTITGVFSNDRLNAEGVKEAYWEIRTGMSEGKGGKVVASKTSPATLHLVEAESSADGAAEYEVRVDGLSVKLPPGRYWLTIAPVLAQGYSYVEATLGANAVGKPPGNNGDAYFDTTNMTKRFVTPDKVSPEAHDFSLGVRIASGR